MSIDHTAAALHAALRAFGETLGRALSEGITQGLQEGLSESLDIEQLVDRVPARTAQGVASGLTGGAAARRGGRPRGEARPCRVGGCADPARSRGLCSRHYQQELRREKAAQPEEPVRREPAAANVEARPPIVRKRPEPGEQVEPQPAPAPVVQAAPATAHEPANAFLEARREEIRSPTDAAKRIFG
ncbi:hypothetical protein [Vulgatibacter sp.]|uniref:hypothetical protein n=1 Tax=Vulgatibacter sp. TaxID=1971226 RepID=UPI003569241F